MIESMRKTIDHLKGFYQLLSGNKDQISLIDQCSVVIPDMGTVTMNSIAIVSADKGTIVIRPYLAQYSKAIQAKVQSMGMSPHSDGKNIYVPIPATGPEQREKIVGQVKKMAEESKVAIRNLRRTAMDETNNIKSEDDKNRERANIDKTTKEFESQIEELCANKIHQITRG